MLGQLSSSTTPWFDPVESYNPSIHNMRNCVIQKLLNPSKPISDDTEVHPALTRFLFPPDEVMHASAVPAISLSKSAGLTLSEFLPLLLSRLIITGQPLIATDGYSCATSVPPKPKLARGRGRKKQAQKPQKTALEELLGDEATTTNGDGIEGGIDDEATQATQQPWYAQSQKLYRHHHALSESQAGFSQSPSQSQSKDRAHQASASPTSKTKQEKKTPENSGKKAGKKSAEDGDSSATEATEDEAEANDPDETMDIDGNQAGHTKPSLLSYDDPIPDFDKLIKQGGMMTSTAMRQSECNLFFEFILITLY